MAKIVPKALALNVDGKTVELQRSNAQTSELSKALKTAALFKIFAADPRGFAARYNLNIDPHIAEQLRSKLSGAKSLADLARAGSNTDDLVGVMAVAVGVYAIGSGKIAVAV